MDITASNQKSTKKLNMLHQLSVHENLQAVLAPLVYPSAPVDQYFPKRKTTDKRKRDRERKLDIIKTYSNVVEMNHNTREEIRSNLLLPALPSDPVGLATQQDHGYPEKIKYFQG